MECFIVEPHDIDLEGRTFRLQGEEAHHASRVLRLRAGEEMLATDLNGTCYLGKYIGSEMEGKEIVAQGAITAVLSNFGEPERNVALIQGVIAQPARWEFLLEKATELGVTEIYPVLTERSEKREVKRDRSERILRAAVKQTKRARKPELSELSSLERALSKALEERRRMILLHESAPADVTLQKALFGNSATMLALVVGPEGGFSDEEVHLAQTTFGAEIVSLGTRRLRAETAAIAALAMAI